MRALPQVLTWGTATAAISSAVWLSSTNPGAVYCSMGSPADRGALGAEVPLPTAPTRAGPPSAPRANSARQESGVAG